MVLSVTLRICKIKHVRGLVRGSSSGFVDEVWYRGGLAVLGAFLGLISGLFLTAPLIYFELLLTSFSHAAFAGAITGAIVGALFPSSLVYGVQAVFYFAAGIVGALTGFAPMDPPPETPGWLWAAVFFGVAYGAALALL